MDNKTHEDSNTFLLTIICHGNKHGHLLDKNRNKAWDTEDFVGDLSEVETLLGKPKILIIQACRGRMSLFCYFGHYRICSCTKGTNISHVSTTLFFSL